MTGQLGEEGEASFWLAKLGLGAFFAMNVMTLSLLRYSGFLTDLDPAILPKIAYLSFALATPVILLLGGPFLKHALQELRMLSFSMESLIALGAFSAYTASTYATWTGSPRIYFDTATMILVLVTLGRFLEAAAKAKASEGIKKLLELSVKEATLVEDGRERKVPLNELKMGDQVMVRPGERIPVDGIVVEGEGAVDESAITGEARLVLKGRGDQVLGTTVTVDGRLLVEVTRVGEDTVFAQMVRLMEEAQASRGPVRRLVDRMAAAFIPGVIGLASLTFLFWLQSGLETAFLHALAVLLIACPCPLGLATPLATWIGFSRAASSGVLIRSGEALERLSELRTLFFDKTGTLTFGRMALREVQVGAETDEETFLSLCASLEACSEHALGNSLVAGVQSRALPLHPVLDVKVHPGLGIEGIVASIGGHSCRAFVGNERFLRQRGLKIREELLRAKEVFEGQGMTVILGGWEGEAKGLLAFGDKVRPEAKEAVEALRGLGFQFGLLSGDHEAVARAVAEEVGIEEVKAPLLPSEKVEAVLASQAFGAVAMVGDGINDAPALAAASVGIAMGSGTDLAKETADVSIVGGDLRKIPWLIRLARATRRTIRGNLFWAFFYNALGLTLAALGALTPILAALAMVISSLFVILNSLLLDKSFRSCYIQT